MSNSTENMEHTKIKIPYSFAKRNQVLIYESAKEGITIARTENASLLALAELQRRFSLDLDFSLLKSQLISSNEFTTLIEQVYQSSSNDTVEQVEGIEGKFDLTQMAEAIEETEDLLESENDAPIIQLINALLTEAIKLKASDIHVETFEKRLVVRFRIDGVLRTIVEPKRELSALLISRIKIMAKLDIAEKRVPQDGRISLRVAGKDVDVRVSTLPSTNSERVVMRILDKNTGQMNLSSLGMTPEDEDLFSSLLLKPHGIILVTGPTGSGKTTSLYAGLTHINSEERNILTVEDPIEYQLEGIGQTQVNTKSDMTFARGLRAILRQDPDVVMIGEIRDTETAKIAVQASLTGHLVLSTLHTNTAIGAITRLEDMGVEPFLISSSLAGIISQRLVRLLCNRCKKEKEPDEKEKQLLGNFYKKDAPIFKPTGCEECKHQGYKGRVGIYEIIPVTENIRNKIHNSCGEDELTKEARIQSSSIRNDGIRKVASGMTTLDEVLRVTIE